MPRFGIVPPEPPRLTALDGCAPGFVRRLTATLARMRANGASPIVFETLRTAERQAWLYGMGRAYDDGRGIVTNAATTRTSWHGYGLAADIVCANDDRDAGSAFWSLLMQAATAEGLLSGSRWHMQDRPHVQFGRPMVVTPTWRAVALKASGGNAAVWRAVGAA